MSIAAPAMPMPARAPAAPLAPLAPLWRPRHNPWLIAVTVTMATFMEVLDTAIANVSLPHIAGNLSASVDESTWVLTSYLVANAVVLPLSGWFCTLLGRKRYYMTCVAIFTVSSALCGLAPSLGLLVFFRIVQGIGGGGLQPSEQAILVDTFPPAKRAMGMAVYGVAVVVAPIIGPTLGGWITDNFSWRWIFFINVPVGLLSMAMTWRLVEDPPHLPRRSFRQGLRIDYIGFSLIALGLGFLQVVLDKGQREDWFASKFIVICAVIGVLAVLGAIFWEPRQKEPMVDLRLLKDRNFLVSTFLMFALGFVLYGSTVLLPIYLQTLMGYSATWAGLVLSPGGLVTMALMPIAGMLLGKTQPRWLIAVGLAIVGTSLLNMSRFNLDIDYRTAMLARMWQAGGLAFLFLPINTASFDFVPKHKINYASGLINLARNLGGSFGIAFVTTMLARRTQVHQQTLAAHTSIFSDATMTMLSGAKHLMVVSGADPVTAANQAAALLYGLVQRQAAMLAFIDIFRILGMIFLCMMPVVLLLRKRQAYTGGMGAH